MENSEPVLQIRNELLKLQLDSEMKQKHIDTLKAKTLKHEQAIKEGQLEHAAVKLSKGDAEKKVSARVQTLSRTHYTHHTLRTQPRALPLPAPFKGPPILDT